MLERIGQLAEEAATTVSRREALTRIGKGALAAAAWLGGMAAGRSDAGGGTCCYYVCGRQRRVTGGPRKGRCPQLRGCRLLGAAGCRG
jgi:hypothetical protein